MVKKNEKATKETEGEEASTSGNEETTDVLSGGVECAGKSPSEKETLLALLQQLKDLGINSIGDLEVKISRLN